MGNKNFEQIPKTPTENEGNDMAEIEVVGEGEIGTEEKVIPEIPDETQEMDPEALESFKEVPEAPLEDES